MFFWRDELVQREHIADLQREAERERLIRQALAQNGQRVRGGPQILNALRLLFRRREHPSVANTQADPHASERLVWLEHLEQSQEGVTECNG